MPKQNLFIIALVLLLFKVNAQTKILTIDEVNEIALNQSNRVKMINNDFTKSKIESSFYRISLLPSILSRRARSTFKTLPLNGKIACDLLSRPLFAEPPAESPSTR